jgi:hypothetical protein
MAGTTTNFAIPYPSVTDYVTDGATAMRSIADQVDAVLFTGSSSGNLLINGAMQVAQRSTSVALISSGNTYHTADRYKTEMSSLGTWTQSVENDAPTGSGFRKSLKMLCTTANASPAGGNYCVFYQLLEGQNLQAIRKGTASAQTLTVSFWVKSGVIGTYICEAFDLDNNRQVSKSYTINAINTWEYKTLTFPADTTGAFDNDNGASLHLQWFLGAGSNFTSGTLNTVWNTSVNANRAVGQVNLAAGNNAAVNYWQMTGAQLTVGSIATPFEFKSYADDLRACQRYYYRLGNTSVSGAYLVPSNNIVYSASSIEGCLQHPVPMRTSAVTFGSNSVYAYNVYQGNWVGIPRAAVSSSNSTTHAAIITDRSGGTSWATFVTGTTQMAFALVANTSAGYIEVSAEL